MTAKKDLRKRTYARYESMLPRINAAIGHLRIGKIQPPHLRAFYSNLSEEGIREDIKYKCQIDIDKYLMEHNLSTAALCRRSGIPNTTMVSIRHGNNVNLENAEKLAAALDMPIDELFKPANKQTILSDTTILHYHRLISVIMNTAVEWGILSSNPCDRTRTPRADTKEACYLDEAQSKLLLSILDQEADETKRTIVRLLLLTGMRRGEALGLKWSDVDFNTKTLKICRTLGALPKEGVFEDKTKNKSSERTIKLPQISVNDLLAHKNAQLEQRMTYGTYWKGEDDYVFTSPEGEPIWPDSISSWFSKLIAKHPELPPITLHGLRHTNASIQLVAGVPLPTVSKRLGHSNSATTARIYAHFLKSSDDTAAEKLNDVFSSKDVEKVG